MLSPFAPIVRPPRNTIASPRFIAGSKEHDMDREKISNGPNDRPLNDGPDRPVPRTGLRTAGGSSDRSMIAGTGPGIPDDALGPGEELPEPPSDEEVERAAEALGSPTASGGVKEK